MVTMKELETLIRTRQSPKFLVGDLGNQKDYVFMINNCFLLTEIVDHVYIRSLNPEQCTVYYYHEDSNYVALRVLGFEIEYGSAVIIDYSFHMTDDRIDVKTLFFILWNRAKSLNISNARQWARNVTLRRFKAVFKKYDNVIELYIYLYCNGFVLDLDVEVDVKFLLHATRPREIWFEDEDSEGEFIFDSKDHSFILPRITTLYEEIKEAIRLL
ncbi:Hypothetical protein POVR1_LOCUS427 [uncultured virus]|nr:Hypothetical protein POVR1_LOCUS427 [uncultured virus]